jgi:hypothetical protein
MDRGEVFMPNRIACVFAGCALLLGSSPAWAQAPAGPAAPTLVAPVTVQSAAPPKVIKKQTQSFVETYSVAAPKLDLIARWRRSVCVQVVNLPPEQAALVKARVEEVARGVGIEISKPGCVSNVQIVLTSQPQAFIDKLTKENERVLGFHYPSDLKRLKTVTHPIQAWYQTATLSDGNVGDLFGADLKDADGNYVSPYDAFPIPMDKHETLDVADTPGPIGCAGFLMTDCVRSAFVNVLVVMDSHAVEGKSLGALADYMAVLALSQAKPALSCSPLPSIFDLLVKTPCAGRDTPEGLMPADAAFLTALYAPRSDVSARLDRGQMEDRMADILIKAQAGAKKR